MKPQINSKPYSYFRTWTIPAKIMSIPPILVLLLFSAQLLFSLWLLLSINDIRTTVIQPPILAGLTSDSMLLAAQAMTSASTSTVSSTSQYSAETLLAILERPSTSLSQSIDVVMETPDLEVILPSKDPTVATRPFVHLCDPTSVTLLCILRLWNLL